MKATFNRRHFITTAATSTLGASTWRFARADSTNRLRAGAAIADMTPAVGVSLKGPIAGNGTVKKVHDPLHARCLALDDGATRLAICVCDATMIGEPTVERAKRLVHQRIGLPLDRMLVSATHAHSVARITGIGQAEVDKDYYDYVARQMAEAICRAVANLAPAQVGWGVASKPEFVHLRRFRIEPGSNGPNPFGEVTDRAWMHAKPATRLGTLGRPDPDVSVLSVRHADGRPLAVLANYSIHYVSGFERDTVSADYFACFAEELQTLLGAGQVDPPFVGIMSNGNSGNIGSPGGGYAGMRNVGRSLAEEVLSICEQAEYHARVPLVMREAPLDLGVRRPDEPRIQWARDVLAGSWNKPAHAWRDIYARNVLDLAKFPATVSPKFQAIRIGDVGIAANPNEMYADTGLEIKARSSLKPTFNIQLANGYHGYLPTPEQHALGGYTTWPAISSYLEINASSKIRDHLLSLLEQVRTT